MECQSSSWSCDLRNHKYSNEMIYKYLHMSISPVCGQVPCFLAMHGTQCDLNSCAITRMHILRTCLPGTWYQVPIALPH